jgi:hypothetical protein
VRVIGDAQLLLHRPDLDGWPTSGFASAWRVAYFLGFQTWVPTFSRPLRESGDLSLTLTPSATWTTP